MALRATRGLVAASARRSRSARRARPATGNGTARQRSDRQRPRTAHRMLAPLPQHGRQALSCRQAKSSATIAAPACQRRGALDAVVQLADIARENSSRVSTSIAPLREGQAALVLRIEPLEEFVGEQRDVAFALAQRRQHHRHHADAVIEVGAKFVLGDRIFEVPVGRRHQPDIDLDGLVAADALELALLQDAQQLGLERRRDLADLVEEQRAAVGQSRSGPCGH